MNVPGQLLFLGTGGSMGIPVIGCDCEVCQSASPHNKRLRPSVLCSVGQKHFLIDCGPDFKIQALKYHLNAIDGVIFTHAHHDHTAGIDELRIYCVKGGKSMPCLLSVETANDLKRRFYYLFEENAYSKYVAHFDLHLLDKDRGEVNFLGLKIRYFTYEQASMRVNGYRLGDLAYVTDLKFFSDDLFEELKGIKTLIVSALRFTSSPMHLNVDEAIDFARRTHAENVWFMHIAHELEHEKGNAYLPDNMRLAYDGLRLDFEVEITE